MDMDSYQQEARKTAIYPGAGRNIIYPVLGLAGEAGEVAEKVKKMLRDGNGVMDSERRDSIIKELGDVLWYVANIASELGTSLSEVAERNLEKLRSRKERGMLRGEGDER